MMDAPSGRTRRVVPPAKERLTRVCSGVLLNSGSPSRIEKPPSLCSFELGYALTILISLVLSKAISCI